MYFFFFTIDSFGQIQSNDKAHSGNGKHSMMTNDHMALGEKELLRLKYQNSEKTVILTGITKPWA